MRCLARVKTSNLKGIKCKCDDHMPTSNTDTPTYTQPSHSRLAGWGAVKMTMGFCHANQVQNISTAGQVLSCWISVKRAFATKSRQLNHCLPLRVGISYTCIMCIHISFHPDLKLEYGNKGNDDYKGYPAVQGGEKKTRGKCFCCAS